MLGPKSVRVAGFGAHGPVSASKLSRVTRPESPDCYDMSFSAHAGAGIDPDSSKTGFLQEDFLHFVRVWNSACAFEAQEAVISAEIITA